jgi:hypothetical protein
MSKHISDHYDGPVVVKPNRDSFGGQNVLHFKSTKDIRAKSITFEPIVQSLEQLDFEVRLDLVRHHDNGSWVLRSILECPFTKDKWNSKLLNGDGSRAIEDLMRSLPSYLNAITIDGTMNESLDRLIIYEINGSYGLRNHFLQGPRMQWSRFLFGDVVDWLASRVPLGLSRWNFAQPWKDIRSYVFRRRTK